MKVGDRIIQIPLDWPRAREGTVASIDGPQIFVAWDDGRKSWIHQADFVREGIWLVHPKAAETPEEVKK